MDDDKAREVLRLKREAGFDLSPASQSTQPPSRRTSRFSVTKAGSAFGACANGRGQPLPRIHPKRRSSQ